MTSSPREPAPKSGERLATQILEEVAAAGWPIGTVLGTEPELLERYGVSRGTLRQAVRLLEHLHVARTREGRGGGLVVTRPTRQPVAHAAAIHLRYEGVGIDELYAARESVESDIIGRAVARLDGRGQDRLRAVIDDEATVDATDDLAHSSELHLVLADLAGNRPLALFLDVLISLSDEYSRPKIAAADLDLVGHRRDSHRAHAAIAAAVLAGDGVTASRRMRSHLRAVETWMPRD